MNDRIRRLRQRSLDAVPSISGERAALVTEFYASDEAARVSTPVRRGLAFKYILDRKTVVIGDDELIVGERGPAPKATPTYPEVTCHSLEDLDILDAPPQDLVQGGRRDEEALCEADHPVLEGAVDAGPDHGRDDAGVAERL